MAIGIDLGTTYCCCAVQRADGQVEIIPNDVGGRTTASYVAVTPKETLIGDQAKNVSAMYPKDTFFDVKRIIGRPFNDAGLQQDKKTFPFLVKQKEGSDLPILETTNGQQFAPEELSAKLLARLKANAEAYLGRPISKAVITVPAYFNDAQRRATATAGSIAGLTVLRIINEPTAAALAYASTRAQGRKVRVLIFDYGGGTHDVSLLNVDDDVIEVIATSGDSRLGGEDIDTAIVEWALPAFLAKQKGTQILNSPRTNPRAMRRLRTAAEVPKKELSTMLTTTLSVEAFHKNVDLSLILTRAKLDELADSLYNRTLEPVRKVLADAKLTAADVDEVILVGGSTRIPRIRTLVEGFFGKKPSFTVNPDECVAHGAALQAASLCGAKKSKALLLIDVCPLSLGIRTVHDMMAVLVRRGSPIPTKATKLFSTWEDNQSSVEVAVYEGEMASTKMNNLLGSFEVNVPRMPRGVPVIEITLSLDVNGVLSVAAVEKSTGRVTQQRVTGTRIGMNESEVSKAVDRAEKDQATNDAFRAVVPKRVEVEGYVYDIRRDFTAMKATDAEKAEVSKRLDELADCLADSATTADKLNEMYNNFNKWYSDLVRDVSARVDVDDVQPASQTEGQQEKEQKEPVVEDVGGDVTVNI